MSLRPHVLAPVPEETARVACAAFPKGNPSLTLRDALGTIFQDDDFTDLYSHEGQPGLSAWRLALVTLMQFREGLRIYRKVVGEDHPGTASLCTKWLSATMANSWCPPPRTKPSKCGTAPHHQQPGRSRSAPLCTPWRSVRIGS